MSTKKKPGNPAAMLGDPSIPIDHRRQLLMHLLMGGGDEGAAAVTALLEAATNCAAQTPVQLVWPRQATLVMLAVAESQRQGVPSSKATPDSP